MTPRLCTGEPLAPPALSAIVVGDGGAAISAAAKRFDALPLFSSQYYDVPINYVGHAETWDALEVEGDIMGKDWLVRYKVKGRTLAAASIYRDVASLQAEVVMEQERP